MKTKFSLLLVLMCLIIAAPSTIWAMPPGHSNLLANGSFEFWSMCNKEWAQHRKWGDKPILIPVRWDTSTAFARSEDARGGKYAAATKSKSMQLTLGDLECNPGSTYSYGVWAKGKGKVTVRINGKAIEGMQHVAQASGEVDGGWTCVGGEIKIPTHLRIVQLTISVQNQGEEFLLDDAYISCDPGFAYDPDELILKKPQRDKDTIFLADLESDKGIIFTSPTNKSRIIDGGKFGRALKLEKSDMAVMSFDAAKMPPEGTVEVWMTYDNNSQFLTLSGGGNRIIELGGNLSWVAQIPKSRGGENLGWHNHLINQQDRPGEFTHAALTWGPDGMRCYSNGTLVNISSKTPIMNITPGSVEFGSKLSHKTYTCIIDEFRLSGVQRYRVLAPKGDTIVPLPPPASEEVADAEPEAPEPESFDAKEFAKQIAPLVTPLPTTEGKFETTLNDKGQYIYEASALKPLITHCKVEPINGKAAEGMSLATIPGSRSMHSENPDIYGAYWQLGKIKPGRYWVSVFSGAAVFHNGRIVQATRAGDPVQLWPGRWISERFVDEPLNLKEGDEIALQVYGGGTTAAQLVLHTSKPEIGKIPAETEMGGAESNLYTSHALSMEITWQDTEGKALPLISNYWRPCQRTSVPATIRKGPDGRPVVRVLMANTLPVAVKAEVEITVHSFYRIKVGSLTETVTLEPHQSLEKLVPFDPIDDEPAYSAYATIKAIKKPKLDWPEGDKISIFKGSRQSLAWADPFEHRTLRRLEFTSPIKSVRQVLNLSGQRLWERAYTPDFRLVPAPADLKWEIANVPMSWGFNYMFSMKPRMHSMYLRRKFTLPPEAAGRTYNLIIEAVQDAADAWINGVYVGQVLGGNVPMVADATKAMKVGENEIILLVRDLLPLMNPAYVNPAKPQPSAFYLDIPGFFSGNGVGIEDVWIETSPIIAANELQALPSFRNKKLTTRYELVSHRAEPAKVRVKTHILAEGKSVLAIDEREMTLEPNKVVPMNFEKPWKNPRLWGPEDPYFYVLAVEIFDAASGERIDNSRARFGFRECWIDGPNIMLNGTPVRPIGMPTPRYRHAPIMTRGPRGMPDYWSEMGRMGFKFCTQLTNSSSRHNIERDLFWENAQKNAIKHINRYINQPCIVSWDLSNEWLCFLWYSPPDDPMFGPKRFKTLSDAIRAYDPTRWTTANGEGDWHGLNDNMCFHYLTAWSHCERTLGHKRIYPDGEFWRPLNKHFEPGQDIVENPLRSTCILRPDKKVIIDSEFLWKVGETMPPALTEVCDEDNVLGYAVDSASGPAFWHWMTKMEGHRDLGVAPIHTYKHPGVQARAFAPKFFIMPELDHNAFSGTKFVRLYTMMNDGLHPADVELKWELLDAKGKVVTKGKDSIRGMKTGYNHQGKIELTLPKVNARTTYTLNARMYAGGKFEFGRELDIDVWPGEPISPGQLQRQVYVFDPAGKTAAVLNKMGVKHQLLASVGDPISQPDGSVLIIGEETLSAENAAGCLKVLEFVKAGGRTIILQQTITPLGLPAPTKLDTVQWASICFNRMPLHPVVDGLSSWDLSFWGVNHVSGKGSYIKPSQGTFVTLIDSGHYEGLEYVNLMEQYVGKGLYMLCQMPVVAKYDEEPMARELLARIVRYTGSGQPYMNPSGTLQAVVADDSPMVKRLDSVEASFNVTKLDAKLDPKAPLLIEAEIARKATDAQRANLASYIKAGGTAVVSCPTPEDEAWVTALAGTDVKFTLQKYITWRGRAMRIGYSPLTAGISHLELYWKNYDKAESAGGQSDNYSLTIEPIQDFSVSAAGARELVWPGAMLELKVGSGTLVIDQRRLNTVNPKLATHATRNTSALLMGLGVKMDPAMPKRSLPKEIAYRTIDLTQFANRSFIDEQADDGKGGWTDQGPGADLRTFPAGKYSLHGVPFVIGKDPNNCIVLASAQRPGADKMPREVVVPIGYPIEGLDFLHANALTPAGKTAAVYQVIYEDGSTFEIPLKGEVNIRDWSSRPAGFSQEKNTSSTIAWTGSCEMYKIVAAYKMRWVNPRPEVAVKAMRFYKTDDMQGVPILMGLTSITKPQAKKLTDDEKKQVRQLIVDSDKATKAKDIATARKLLQQALAIDPMSWDSYQKLADILEQKGSEDELLAFYRSWVRNGATVPLPYNRIAQILEARKDLNGALEYLTRSLQVEWNQPPVIEDKKRLEQTLHSN